MKTLAPFPVDDLTLDLLSEAADSTCEVEPDGTYRLVGAEFTLQSLLNLLSGYDETRSVDTGRTIDGIPVFHHPDPIYSVPDVLRALVAEIRRLRNQNSQGEANR